MVRIAILFREGETAFVVKISLRPPKSVYICGRDEEFVFVEVHARVDVINNIAKYIYH